MTTYRIIAGRVILPHASGFTGGTFGFDNAVWDRRFHVACSLTVDLGCHATSHKSTTAGRETMKLREAILPAVLILAGAWALYMASEWLAHATMGLFR